jgi:hypothetical protein
LSLGVCFNDDGCRHGAKQRRPKQAFHPILAPPALRQHR